MNNNNHFYYNNQPNMDGSLPGTSVVVKSEVADVKSMFHPIQTFMGFSVVPKIEPSSSDTKFDVTSGAIQSKGGKQKKKRKNEANHNNEHSKKAKKKDLEANKFKGKRTAENNKNPNINKTSNMSLKAQRRLKTKIKRLKIKELAMAQINGYGSPGNYGNENNVGLKRAKKIQRMVDKILQKKATKSTKAKKKSNQNAGNKSKPCISKIVCVSSVNYPNVKLLEVFKESLQEALDSRLDKIFLFECLPKFRKFELIDGFICIHCLNEFSAKWIESTIKEISPLDGTELETTRNDMRFRRKIIAMVPGKSTDPQTVLARLKRFNPELQIKNFLVVRSEEVEGYGLKIILSINEKFAKELVGTEKQAGMVMVSFSDFAQADHGPERIADLTGKSVNGPKADVSTVKKEPGIFSGPSTSKGTSY